MKHRSPVITLAVGALLAVALLILDIATQPSGRGDSPAAVVPAAPSARTTPPATTAPATLAAPAPPNGTFAGDVDGASGASIAIAVRNGHAIAYLCDGRIEAWLQGQAANGSVRLAGANRATLTGTYASGRISGAIAAAGRTWTFTIGAVAPPSGLYRSTAQVRQAKVVGGWIVLPGGRQVGVVDIDGEPVTATALDLTTLTSTVDDTTVTATAVDGSPIQ